MIIDVITNNERYHHLSPSLKEAFDFLRCNDCSFQNQQRHEVGTKGIYALFQEYTPKKKIEKMIEAHRHYIDIQYMAKGKEYLGYAYKKNLTSRGYDKEHDFETLVGDVTLLPFHKDQFAVLFPDDAHMPGVKSSGSTKTVKKIVLKVPVELWKEK